MKRILMLLLFGSILMGGVLPAGGCASARERTSGDYALTKETTTPLPNGGTEKVTESYKVATGDKASADDRRSDTTTKGILRLAASAALVRVAVDGADGIVKNENVNNNGGTSINAPVAPPGR